MLLQGRAGKQSFAGLHGAVLFRALTDWEILRLFQRKTPKPEQVTVRPTFCLFLAVGY